LIMPERAELYDAINQRYAAMVKNGGLTEARNIAARGLGNDLPVMKAVGLPPLLAHLRAELSYDEAVAFVLESRRASISAVQRKLRIGYNRAARLIEAMEAAGVVSMMNTNGSREVLVPDRDAQ